MKRDLHVELIKQYILDRRTKSFEEVTTFADELGASEEEIEAAIYQVAHYKAQMVPRMPHEITEHLDTPAQAVIIRVFRKKYLFVLAFFAVFGSAAAYLNFTIHRTPDKPYATTANTVIAKPPVEIEQVYANQKQLYANKIFSFPAVPVTLSYTSRPTKEVVGFFPYWMIDAADKVQTNAYSSINFFGLETDGNGNIVTQSSNGPDGGWGMWTNPQFDTLLSTLKKKKIKRLLTIKSFNDSNIEHLATSDASQIKFISNVLQLVNSKDLDGVNLDFEYTGSASPAVRLGFVRLVANLDKSLHDVFPASQITVDTFVTSGANENLFDLAALEDYVHAFIIMGYDIHTPQGNPGPVSPFEGASGIIGYMESYLQMVDPTKLILAVPYYGYDWADTDKAEMLSYAEIADLARSHPVQWDTTTKTPHLTYTDTSRRNHQVYFENTRSLGIKYDYVKSKNLAGIGVWAMGYEGYSPELVNLILDKFGNK